MRTPRVEIDLRISQLAACTHGIVDASSLAAAGVSRSCIHNRVTTGQLHPVLPRAYAWKHGGAELSRHARMSAAAQSLRPDARISHTAAAALHGLWSRGGDDVHVTTVRHHPRFARPPWLVVHRRPQSLGPDDVVVVDRIPTSAVWLCCVEASSQLTPWQLASVLHEARFRDILDLQRIDEYLCAHPQARGTRSIRHAVSLYRCGSAGTRSRSEDEALRLIIAAHLPLPLVNTRGSTNVRGIECDFVWRPQRLVVEIDGSGHAQPGAAEHDAARDAALADCGWRVHRVNSRDVWRHRATFVRSIACLLETPRD